MRVDFKLVVHLSLTVVSLVFVSQNALGQTAWEWRVDGISQPFPSKAAAEAALLGQSPSTTYSLMEPDGGAAKMDATSVSYRYSIRPRQRIALTEWRYTGTNDPTLSSSEAAAVQGESLMLQQLLAPNCPVPVLTPNGAWVSDPTPDDMPSHKERNYTTQVFWPGTCAPRPQGSVKIHALRNVSCPTGFLWQSPVCVNTATAYVRGYKLEKPCDVPGGGCTGLGNPIDAATGAKFESAVDLNEPGIRFARSYNSLTETRSSIGFGWTHSYETRLVFFSSALQGIVRPDGTQEYLRSAGSSLYQSTAGSGLVAKQVGTEWLVYENDGRVSVFDSTGKLLRINDHGRITTLSYTSGVLTSISGPGGHSIQLEYVNGLVSRIIDSAGNLVDYTYNADGMLTQVAYPDASSRQYSYDKVGFPRHLTGITDESGSPFAIFDYDSIGRAISTEHAGGVERYTFAYGSAATTVVDPLSSTRVYNFTTDNTGRRVTSFVQESLTRSAVIPVYDTDYQRRPTSTTDARGITTKHAYDSFHKTSETSAFGTTLARTKTTQFLNNETDLPTLVTEPNRKTAFTYDTNGNVLTRTITDTSATPNVSRVWTFTYDSAGRQLTEDGPRTDVSDITTYTYYNCTSGYQCGQLNTATNALGHTTTYNSYNAHGQPTQITDSNGLVMSVAYDLRQRVTDRCTGGTLPGCAGGELTHIDYWPTGLLKKVTNPDGSYVEYTYDAGHRLTQIKDGALNRVVYTLDAMSNRTAENTYDPSSALRRTHSRVFNTLNQLWKDVNAAGTAAVTTTFGYDNSGNQTSVAAPMSRNSSSLYDELNRLKQIADPASGITQFGYDANDNLASVTDPRGLVTSYTYTGFGDLKTQTSPDTGLTTNAYDSAGNLATSTDSRGAVTAYGYDNANRVTSTAFTLGGVTDQTITYGYDASIAQNGRLTSASDANHTLAWNYDLRGRVTGKSQTVGGVTLAMSYGYNAAGRLGTVTLPSGNGVVFGYNANGQITSLTLNGSTTILSGITYDPFGPITGWTWGNGTTTSRTFDTDGKITQLDNANGAGLKDYSYDDAFRITGIADAMDPALSWTYGHDSLDRLTSANKPGFSQGWTYDTNGNRMSETGSMASSYVNSTTSNRVNSTSGSLVRTYGYDAAGNILSYGNAAFVYNNRGRMATASNAGITATYLYNAIGQRISRTAAGVTTLYDYDEAGHLVGEYTATGALVQEIVWLGDLPVATLRPNGSGGVNLFYVHADHLNAPRLVTDSANNIRWKWDSDAFGNSPPNQNPLGLGAFEFNLRFPGQQYDAIIGLHYNYFRDYDPASGRYVESDPIGLNGGTNTYTYVRSRPTKRVDPRGLCDQCNTNNTQPHGDTIEEVARRMIARYLTASVVSGVEYCAWICQEPNLKTYFSMPAQRAPIEGDSGSCQIALLQPCPECSIRRALWHTHYADAGTSGEGLSNSDINAAQNLTTGRMDQYGYVSQVTAQGIDVYAGTPSRHIDSYYGRSGRYGPMLSPQLRPGEGVNRH